jgi:hypothetical protein
MGFGILLNVIDLHAFLLIEGIASKIKDSVALLRKKDCVVMYGPDSDGPQIDRTAFLICNL